MRSLQSRLILVFFLFVLVSVSLIGSVFYYKSTSLVSDMVGTQAVAIAEHAKQIIDPAVFKQIIEEGDGGEAYAKLRSRLNEIRTANGLKYLYTMRMIEEQGKKVYVYVVDGMPEGSDDASGFGETEENPDDGLLALFETGREQVGELDYSKEYGATLTAYLPITDKDGTLLGTVGADFDGDRIYELQRKNKLAMLLIGAVLLAVALFVSIIVARLLSRPLRRLSEQVEIAGNSDFTVTIETDRKDEIGRLARSFAGLIDNLRLFIQVIREHAAQLEQSVATLSQSSSTTKVSSERIAITMREATVDAEIQLQRSAETARTLDEVAVGASRIAEAAADAAETSALTRSQAEQGSLLVAKVENQMRSIREASEALRRVVETLQTDSLQIDEIVVTIARIAAQTKILALNAGIEAARAGEQGKGFAVVADEIRKLAEQTAASSDRIAGLIGAVREETGSTVAVMEETSRQVEAGRSLVTEAGLTFEGIVREIRRLDEKFAEVSAAAEEMAAGTEEAAAAVGEAEQAVTRSVRHFAETAAASSEQQERVAALNDEAETLRRMAGDLSGLIRKFKI